MKVTVITSLLVAASLTASASAAASPRDGASLQDAAVRSQEAYVAVAPTDGGAFIELAQNYARAGRIGEAAGAYRRALALDNMMLVTKAGDSIWSHQVARSALARIPQLSAR